MEQVWKNTLQTENTDFDNVYKNKIKSVKENKLAETNFKILHGILPCGVNLKRWRISNSDKCTICNDVENISHPIYQCIYAKCIWEKISQLMGITICLEDIIFGERLSDEVNFVVSLITFIIYKDWLILSLE